ncbi:MAG: class I SAM-dependent methyltransferase [Anaerolineaceae bacterium]
MKLPSSFRDPSGFMFAQKGVLYRQVNLSYQEHYDQMMESGLYRQLSSARALIPHEECSAAIAPIPGAAYKIIKPEPIAFISYPYEWCFDQLKDAAVLTLSIARRALQYDMILKDASAFNVQFLNGKPIFIDTLSFERYQPGTPWVAYKQFCQHFLAPLSLMAKVDIRLNQLLRVYIDGIPLDLTSALLPKATLLSPNLLSHIHLHAKTQQKYAGAELPEDHISGRMTKNALLGLLDSLLSTIRGLKLKAQKTEWENYYEQTNYAQAAFELKRQKVSEFILRVRPRSVWDLGANTGEFSRAASNLGIQTIAFDIDQGAVERNYALVKQDKETKILPLCMDLTNPSPALGWNCQERMSLLERAQPDMVMALALVHHLAISNNIPLESLADFFAALGRWLIIEFIPKSDSQVKRLLSSRQDIFPDYTKAGFESAFRLHFEILEEAPIAGSERILYLMERKQAFS